MNIAQKVNALIAKEDTYASGSHAKKKIGYTCNFVPPEIIYAAGFTAVRMFNNVSTSHVSIGDTYMQRNTCPFVRGCIGRIAGGDFDYLAAVVGAHTCDNMRGMCENLEYFDMSPPMIFQIDVPRNPGRRNGIVYYAAQLREMIPLLERISGQIITEASIAEAIRLYTQVRTLLRSIYNAAVTRCTGVNTRMVFQLIHKMMTVDPALYLDELKQIETVCSMADEKKHNSQLRVALMGSLLPKDNYRIIDIAESNQVNIVDDFLCSGSRYLEQNILLQNDEKIVEAVAKGYLRTTACSRMYNDTFKQNRFETKLDPRHVDGVIFFALKFCDSMLYEAAHISKLCRQRNLPYLYIESELTEQDHGQIKTRLEAFFENIQYRN